MNELIKEYYILEKNSSKLYICYSEVFNEDKDFWIGLSLEEEKHASIIETWDDMHSNNLLPEQLLYNDIDKIIESNKEVKNYTDLCRNKLINKIDAYNKAIEFEKKTGEAYFQYTMSKFSNDELIKVFQDLVKDEINHAERIDKVLKKYEQ